MDLSKQEADGSPKHLFTDMKFNTEIPTSITNANILVINAPNENAEESATEMKKIIGCINICIRCIHDA